MRPPDTAGAVSRRHSMRAAIRHECVAKARKQSRAGSILGVLSNCQLDAAALDSDITAQRIAFTQLGIEPIERMVIQCGLRRLRSLVRESWWLAFIAWPAVAYASDP